MNRYLILFILFITVTSRAFTQTEVCYYAYVSDNMGLWRTEIDELQSAYEAKGTAQLLYELTLAQYGYIAWCMSTGKKEMAADYVVRAGKNADKLLSERSDWGRVYSLRAALFGFEVGQKPYKAPVLGIRAQKLGNLALELDPGDPYVLMEIGNMELYKPRILGGDRKAAIRFYLESLELFEQDSQLITKNWLYLNTLSGLAIAYTRTGSYRKADRVYCKILETEADFAWIRDDVYPAFRRKYFPEE